MLTAAAQAHDISPQGPNGSAGLDEARLCLARAEDALGKTSAAAEILASLRAQSSSPVITAQARLVTASAADHHRDDHQAQSALDRALAIAEPEGIRRPFAALGGRRIETMLRHRLGLTGAALEPAAPGFVEALLSGFGAGHHLAVEPEPLVEPLTDREQAVLCQLATMRTNEEIASELFVSVNTIKAHARAVYRKLEVPNRREAVTRGRSLGLI